MEEFKQKAEKKRQELSQAEAASQEGEEGDEERRNHLDELTNEAEESSVRKQALEQDLKRAVEPHKALERQLKALQKEEDRAKRALLEANKRLQLKRDEIAARAGSAESEQAQRNERLRAFEEKLVEGKAKHNELKQAVTNALQDYENLEPQVLDAKGRLSQKEKELGAIEYKIRSMRSSTANSLDVFGQRCARVKKLVDKAIEQRRFRGPVVGPIGYFCKVQPGKQAFASLAESALGPGVLDRFIVCNDADRKLFQTIRREAGCQSDCGVFQQAQHARYNIPDPPQMEGIETISSVISVQNDLVFNCLVDNCKIDERALTRSKEESERQLLVLDDNGRQSIRGNKIKEVYFLPKGDNWKLTKGGNIQMISNTRRMTQSIGIDMEGAIREAEVELQSTKEELNTLNRDFARLDFQHTDQKKIWNAKKKELLRNQKEMDDCQKAIEDIKSEEANVADMDADTSLEESEVSEAQEFLDDLRDKQLKTNQQLEEKKPEIQELKEKLVEVTERNKKVLADLKEAENSLAQFFQHLSQQKEKLEKKRQKVVQYERIISEVR
jgi:chromosome segregation ATPase